MKILIKAEIRKVDGPTVNREELLKILYKDLNARYDLWIDDSEYTLEIDSINER